MPDAFNAYYKWLAIPPEEQPAHYYRLLGVRAFESDPDVIASAADQRMAHVRTFQTGQHSALSQQLLNEIAAARVCLLNVARKAAYDQLLRSELQAAAPPAAPSPPMATPFAPPAAPFAPPNAPTAVPPLAAPLQHALPYPPPAAGSSVRLAQPTLRDGATAEAEAADGAEPAIRSESVITRRARAKQKSWVGTAAPIAVAALVSIIGLVAFLKTGEPESEQHASVSHQEKSRSEGSGLKGAPASSDVKPSRDPKVEAEPTTVSDANDPQQADKSTVVDVPAKTGEVVRQPHEIKKPKPEKSDRLSAAARKLLVHVAGRVAEGAIEQSEPAGGGGGGFFEEVPQSGALLVGLNLGVGNYAGHLVLRAVQGVYLSSGGISFGEDHGELGADAIKLLAKPGYAIGAFTARAGQRVDGLAVVFMRIHENRLDPKDAYSSQWVGGEGGGVPTLVSGEGRAVVGIFGGIGAELDRFGLMVDEESGALPAELPGAMSREERPIASRPLLLPKKDRLPVPSADAQRDALALIRNLFKDDYAEATKGSPQKFALAEKLFHKAEETNDDPTARYVMICEARDLAARCGNSQAVGDTIIMLANLYDIDDVGMTLTSFERVAEMTSAPLPFRRRLVENCMLLIDRAVAQEKYDVAEQLGAIGKRAASKSQDSVVAQRLQWRIHKLHEQKAAYDEAQESIEILKLQPDSPTANTAVGRYRCLFQDDWQHGLPLLAKGSDTALKKLADQELADEGNPDDECKLADAWDALGKANEKYRSHYERRAKHWYERAQHGLRGIQKARVEKKIDELLAGRGLKVEFFRTASLTAPNKVLTRIDPDVDFHWGKGEPASDVPADDFSVRLSGLITAPVKGEYQLTLEHDDGARLWIDNKIVIEAWSEAGTSRAMVSMAGKPRAIKIEVFDAGSEAHCVLKWAQKGGFTEQIVPPEAFWQEHWSGPKSFAQLPNPAYPKTFVKPR
jgi:hypothetical protein